MTHRKPADLLLGVLASGCRQRASQFVCQHEGFQDLAVLAAVPTATRALFANLPWYFRALAILFASFHCFVLPGTHTIHEVGGGGRK